MSREQLKTIDEILKLLGFARANLDHAMDQPEERQSTEEIAKQQLLKAQIQLSALIGKLG